MYAEGLPAEVRLKALTRDDRLPFVFEAGDSETHFTNGYDPDPRARQLSALLRPATLARILLGTDAADEDAPIWRAKVRHLPELDTTALRPAQITAINGVEQSQHFDQPLVQMATGASKTFTAVTLAYRLLKSGGVGILILTSSCGPSRSSKTTSPASTPQRIMSRSHPILAGPG